MPRADPVPVIADPMNAHLTETRRVEGFAPAKINLALHVTGRRADGYHELDMLVGFADIGDSVRWTVGGDSCRLSVEGTQNRHDDVPVSTANLAWRALALAGLRGKAPLSGTLTVRKALPAGAGLGGGSSDAAAVLRAVLGETVRQDLIADPGVLALGADVPVCLAARPSRVRGIGKWVSAVDLGQSVPVVLVWPGHGLSTPEVFAARDGGFGAPIPEDRIRDLHVDPVAVMADLRNDLEAAAVRLLPDVGLAVAALEACVGCRIARMSGSGSCVVGYFSSRGDAREAALRLGRDRPDWWVRDGNLHAEPLSAWGVAAVS